MHFFDLMPVVPILALRALDNAHRALRLAAIEAVEFKLTVPMSLAHAILFISSLDILQQRVVFVQRKSLVLVQSHLFLFPRRQL